MRVRVRRDDRRLRGVGDVPEAGLVQVRDVDEDPCRLQARTSRRPAAVSPGPVSGDDGKPERHALGERVRPRPDDPDRAEPAVVPVVEIGEVGRERLGALEVHDRLHPARLEVVDPAHDRHVEPLERRGELVGDARRSS